MPSGSKMRVRKNSPTPIPDARSISTPATIDGVWYTHRSPGANASGSAPSRSM